MAEIRQSWVEPAGIRCPQQMECTSLLSIALDGNCGRQQGLEVVQVNVIHAHDLDVALVLSSPLESLLGVSQLASIIKPEIDMLLRSNEVTDPLPVGSGIDWPTPFPLLFQLRELAGDQLSERSADLLLRRRQLHYVLLDFLTGRHDVRHHLSIAVMILAPSPRRIRIDTTT